VAEPRAGTGPIAQDIDQNHETHIQTMESTI
jgi:hypothetical protein